MDEKARVLHQEKIIVDGHCDTILELFEKKRSFWVNNIKGHLDWPRLKTGKINLQFMAFYIEPQYKPHGALSRVIEFLDFFHSIKKAGETQEGINLPVVLSRDDLGLIRADNTWVLLAIEGGEVLEGKLSTLRILYKLGFRSLTLTWNQRNQLADGVWEKDSGGGLTNLGREVIKEMNTLGMLIDVSHLTEKGFWDVISLSQKPIAATHSCCMALHNHPRNLTDSQLKALKTNGGIVGINFFPGFLGGRKVGVDMVAEHIEHAAAIAGIDSVGLGSDFDGINRTPQGLESVDKLPHLTEKLLQRGWKDDDIGKVLGGNFIRVLSETLS